MESRRASRARAAPRSVRRDGVGSLPAARARTGPRRARGRAGHGPGAPGSRRGRDLPSLAGCPPSLRGRRRAWRVLGAGGPLPARARRRQRPARESLAPAVRDRRDPYGGRGDHHRNGGRRPGDPDPARHRRHRAGDGAARRGADPAGPHPAPGSGCSVDGRGPWARRRWSAAAGRAHPFRGSREPPLRVAHGARARRAGPCRGHDPRRGCGRPERAVPVGGPRGRAVRPSTTSSDGARSGRNGSRGGQPRPDRQPRGDDLAAHGHRPVRRDARGTGRRSARRGSHHRARARRGPASRTRCLARGKLRGRDLAPSGHSRRPPWRACPGRLHPEPWWGSRCATGPSRAGRAPAPGSLRVPRPGERAGRRPARRGRDRARAGDRAVGRCPARRHGPRGAGGPPGAPRGPRRRSRTVRACLGRDGCCGPDARDRGDDGDVGSAGRRGAGRRGPAYPRHADARPRRVALPAGEQRRLLAVDRNARGAARRLPRGADRGHPGGCRARRRAGRGPAPHRPRSGGPADAARNLGLGRQRMGGGGPRPGRAPQAARASCRPLAGGVG